MLRITDIGILADDLTGACDVAASFAPAAGPVMVFVSPDVVPDEPGAGLSVINAQSRLATPETSRSLMRRAGKHLGDKKIVFVKVDTALRGPVGAGLEGLLEALGPRKVRVAPALPRIGKTTRSGIQYDAGVPIHQTSYAQDPSTPVLTSDIAAIIRQTGRVICEVHDAESDEDLRRVIHETVNGSETIYVGSLGLADALRETIVADTGSEKVSAVSRRPVFVCGSSYDRAHRQIQQAAAQRGAHVLELNPLSDPPELKIETGVVTPVIIRLVRKRIDRTLCSPTELITRFASLVGHLFDRIHPDGLGIIGGETAYHVFRNLEEKALKVFGRIDEVISYGVMSDGRMAGCPFASKGGSVGPPDSIVQMIDYLTHGKGI